jgi:hypothetical protein
MDREQLEALRRQVEEDYKLDLAAIERLQRRFLGAPRSITANLPSNPVPVSAYSAPSKWAEEPELRPDSRMDTRLDSRIDSPVPTPFAPPERQRDEVEGTLRAMFNGGRPVGR